MQKTNYSNRSSRQTTPSPKSGPNSPALNEPFDEADAELEELSAANEALSLQAQALSVQVVSLTALLAEKGMAEVWRHKWADLTRVATTDYVPGRYLIETPHSDDKVLQVTLRWEPGQVLLCESFQKNPENTLALPLPTVRSPKHYPVLSPGPGTIPPRPASTRLKVDFTMMAPDEQMELDEYNQKWQAHLQPVMVEAVRVQAQAQEQASKDEEELAYQAIQAIQERRQNPRKPPGETISATLQAAAEEMQNRAAQSRF